jgi:hypothetical protein
MIIIIIIIITHRAHERAVVAAGVGLALGGEGAHRHGTRLWPLTERRPRLVPEVTGDRHDSE